MALRTVKPGEKAPPKDVVEAAKSGTHYELLVAMRDRIAVAVNNPSCPPRDLSSLTLRLAAIAKEIEQIERIEAETGPGHEPTSDGTFDPSTV